ncbi:MAG: HD domain-containing phosphohydrolase [Gemmatimonadaceae bacterium]
MFEQTLRNARMLVVDDEPMNLQLLRHILEPAGYVHLRQTSDAREVATIAAEFHPDIVLTDLMMPHVSGLEVLRIVRSLNGSPPVPVLILTSDHSHTTMREALEAGASDLLAKPFSPAEVRLRVRNLLEMRFLHLELQRQNEVLDQRVRERTRALDAARLETLERLAHASEYRDDKTGEHARRVGTMSALLGEVLGVGDGMVEIFRRAAPLHDIGKIGVPDAILLKPSGLTAEEIAVMRTHTTIGARILSGSEFHLLRTAEEIALSHHERWDGQGYPRGLAGSAIPIVGRIVAVADTYDALVHDRTYKRAWSVEEAFEELEAQRGRQFDPELVDAFITLGPALAAGGTQLARHSPAAASVL